MSKTLQRLLKVNSHPGVFVKNRDHLSSSEHCDSVVARSSWRRMSVLRIEGGVGRDPETAKTNARTIRWARNRVIFKEMNFNGQLYYSGCPHRYSNHWSCWYLFIGECWLQWGCKAAEGREESPRHSGSRLLLSSSLAAGWYREVSARYGRPGCGDT
jgi:hypothetical protein